MKKLSFMEAMQRAFDGLMLFIIRDGDMEEVCWPTSQLYDDNAFADEYYDDYDNGDIEFVYDEEAEAQAMEILAKLDDDVKDYLHRLLVVESWSF